MPSRPAAPDTALRTVRRGAALLAVGAVLSLALPALSSSPASAAPAVAKAATLTWRISTNAFSASGSLVQGHSVDPPATESPGHTYHPPPASPNGHSTEGGFTFVGGGTYDPATGATSIHYGGAVTLGNTSFGHLQIKLSNLALTMADGDGAITADVGWCIGATDCGDGLATTPGVTVVQLTDVVLDDASGHVTATPTPDCPLRTGEGAPTGTRQFPQSFLDALDPGLRAFFVASNTGQNATKCPAPVELAWDHAVATTSSTTSTSSSTSTSTSSSTSTTVAASSSTSSTTSSSTPPPADDLDGGTLDWGVKTSFRQYVTGPIAGGTATPAGGATQNGDGTYRFPFSGEGSYDGPDALAAGFGGSVHFQGHDGSLDLRVSDPRVEVDGDDGVLVVDAVSGATTYDDLAFADLDLSGVTPQASGGTVVLADVPATLSSDGAPAFSGFYQAGEALDPVTLTLDLPGGGSATTSTSAPGGPTTSAPAGAVGLSATTAAPGAQLTATGSGFLPGEQVQVFLHSTPRFVTVATADAQGRASITFTVPTDLPAGAHRVELRGVTSGRSLLSGTLTVRAATSGGLARTGVGALGLVRWALLAIGLGLLARGRAQLRTG